jgi:GAF domain-containing protein
MSGEQPASDPIGQHALRESLAEIRQNLDDLSIRFQRLEGERARSSSGSRPSESRPESSVLSLGREILALPSSGLEPAEVFSLAMDRVAGVLSADRAMLFVWEEETSCLMARAGRGFGRDDLDTISIKSGEGLIGQAFQNEDIERTSDGADTLVEDPFLALFPARDAVAVPIRATGRIVGVLLYAGRRALRSSFSDQEVLLLLVIADRVGTALAHRQLVKLSRAHATRLRELEMFVSHVQLDGELHVMLARACETACRSAWGSSWSPISTGCLRWTARWERSARR